MRFREARLAVLAVALLLGIAAVTASPSAAGTDPQRRGRTARRSPPKKQPAPRPAAFSHSTGPHRRSCDACHTFPSASSTSVRAGEAAFPDVTEYPTHGSCLGCHRQQFFARERPAPKICSICHEGVTPRHTARLPFPNPSGPFLESKNGRDFVSEFRIHFDHSMHLALLGESRKPAESASFVRVSSRQQEASKGAGVCATCHQPYKPQGDSSDEYASPPPQNLGDGFWLKKGTFQTSPDGHASCFSCHSVDSGMKPAPSDCAVCHVLAPGGAAKPTDFGATLTAVAGAAEPAALQAWRRRHSSATFRHEGGLHTEVACTTCHDTAAMDTVDDRTTRVLIPSCGGAMGCHVTPTIDDGGAVNFELAARIADPGFRCVKCHLAYATAPVPQSHADAVAKAKKE